MASSAVVTVLPVGVFITTTPCSVAAVQSTLSTPTPARPITRSSGAASITARVMRVAERTTRACTPRTASISAASCMPTRTSGSMPRPRKAASAASASSSQISTRRSEGWGSVD